MLIYLYKEKCEHRSLDSARKYEGQSASIRKAIEEKDILKQRIKEFGERRKRLQQPHDSQLVEEQDCVKIRQRDPKVF